MKWESITPEQASSLLASGLYIQLTKALRDGPVLITIEEGQSATAARRTVMSGLARYGIRVSVRQTVSRDGFVLTLKEQSND